MEGDPSLELRRLEPQKNRFVYFFQRSEVTASIMPKCYSMEFRMESMEVA